MNAIFIIAYILLFALILLDVRRRNKRVAARPNPVKTEWDKQREKLDAYCMKSEERIGKQFSWVNPISDSVVLEFLGNGFDKWRVEKTESELSVFLTPPKGGEIKFPVPILDANDSENICHAMRVFPKIYKNWLELTAPLQELNKVV